MRNGPKFWVCDWVEIQAGTVKDFDGLKTAWVANVDLKGINLKDPESSIYQTSTIVRKSKVGWNKGTTVFLIDDAAGNTWVMKGMQIGLAPATYDALTTNFTDCCSG